MPNIDMRDAFFDTVFHLAENDRNVIFLTDDMGAYSLERFKEKLPDQFINIGIAEQNMISVAAGLCLGGKSVFAYGIAPFVTMRAFEQIKVDLCCMNLPVTIVCVGAGFSYGSDGPTHHATQDVAIMRTLPEMTILNPSDASMTKASAEFSYKNRGPVYVRVERGMLPELYDGREVDFTQGLAVLKKGTDLMIIATGIMVHKAFEIKEALSKYSIDAGIVDFYRIKPVNETLLLEIIDESKKIVTLEENSINGGIGSIVSEVITDNNRQVSLKRLAVQDVHCYRYGDREFLNTVSGLDTDSIIKKIRDWETGSDK